MAFTYKTFQKDSENVNSDAPMGFSYRTADAIATVTASAYFNKKIRDLNVGDRIYVHAADAYKFIIVTSVTTNVTTVAYT